MQNSPLVAWLTDEKGNMQYMNPVCLSIYGLTEKDFGRSMFDLFNWTDALQWQIGNRKILNSGKPSETIEKAVKANGEQQVLKIYKFPLTVNGETMVGGWAADISDQVVLQQKLLKSVERYEYVNEATSDAIYDWNVATGRVYRGTGYETVFGFLQKEVGIKTRLSLIHPDDYGLFKQKVFAALRNPQADKYEIRYRFRHADGSYRHVADKAFIIRSGNTVTRVIGAMQDITAQIELQERLVNQEKESKQQLIKSIIETQEKERRQLSVELHDNVNQMLASCKLMLEVALENTADARMLTEKTYQSIQTVIDELRKISHELNPSAITDVGLVEGIEQLVEKINISGKINIRFIPGKQEYHHYLNEDDKIAIFRIVQEQLNNILKHSRAKNVLITLDVSDEHIKMCIKDDGIGFDPDNCKKGLGLRNIYHRVEYYGGTINIITGQGKGVEMCIALKASNGLCSGRHLKIA